MLWNSVFDWAKDCGVKVVRGETSNDLKRAHAFYKKYGFKFYGQAIEKEVGA